MFLLRSIIMMIPIMFLSVPERNQVRVCFNLLLAKHLFKMTFAILMKKVIGSSSTYIQPILTMPNPSDAWRTNNNILLRVPDGQEIVK